MNEDQDLMYYLDLLHHATMVPVFLYRSGKLVSSFPEIEAVPYGLSSPMDLIADSGADFSRSVAIHVVRDMLFYGYISDPDCRQILIFGPVISLSLNERLLEIVGRAFNISPVKGEHFFEFLKTLPVVSYKQLHYTLLHVYYTLYHGKPAFDYIADEEPATDLSRITSGYFDSLEAGKLYHSYESEDSFLRIIEDGDLRFLQDKKRPRFLHAETAFTPLRNIQNSAVILLTLFPRAAIRGGVSEQIAFTMSDFFIQQSEMASSPKEVEAIIEKAYIDFIKCVHEYKNAPTSNPVLRECNIFIRNNVNQKISTSDLADMTGYNRTYFSKIYKEEFGISPSAYILQSKLNAAKQLLKYSDRTISEISYYLCFSSQSHFQRAFKNEFGITPQAYRRTSERKAKW